MVSLAEVVATSLLIATNFALNKESHSGVVGATATFWHVPIDVLLRHFDRTALAMKAVLSVDL